MNSNKKNTLVLFIIDCRAPEFFRVYHFSFSLIESGVPNCNIRIRRVFGDIISKWHDLIAMMYNISSCQNIFKIRYSLMILILLKIANYIVERIPNVKNVLRILWLVKMDKNVFQKLIFQIVLWLITLIQIVLSAIIYLL